MHQEGPKYLSVDVPMLLIGYGAIARGVLPMLERHLNFKPSLLTIVSPWGGFEDLANTGYVLSKEAINVHNYEAFFLKYFNGRPTSPVTEATPFRGLCVNLSVGLSSLALMKLCRELRVLYVDTVVEPWQGLYEDANVSMETRSNYALRQEVRDYKEETHSKGSTAVSGCGANPGLISFILKEGLLHLAKDITGKDPVVPKTRQQWGELMRGLGVKGLHIAERDTQYSKDPKPPGVFVNTWSVMGFIDELFQPAEVGWGTHERWLPPNGKRHATGCKSAIFLEQPGGSTFVRSWCPTLGAQIANLVTHNESISISDYYTIGTGDNPEYRPTVHYAYHPCDAAVLSIREAMCFDKGEQKAKLLTVNDIVGGADELGVLLYGHAKNAFWYGSTLTHEQCKSLCRNQSATAMQVCAGVLAAVVWGWENPNAGVVESDEMDHARCMEVCRMYLGKVWGQYTDWNPIKAMSTGRVSLFAPPARTDPSDPWQFANVLV